MLQLQRRDRTVPGTSQERESNYCSIALLNVSCRRHCLKDVTDLLDCRDALLPVGRSDSGLIGGRIEIFRIARVDPGPVPALSGEPAEERFQRPERGTDSGGTQFLARPRAALDCKVRFESLRLLNAEVFEVAEFGIALKAV
jgi:hypothetical protein